MFASTMPDGITSEPGPGRDRDRERGIWGLSFWCDDGDSEARGGCALVMR
jgi:hypothetical protein